MSDENDVDLTTTGSENREPGTEQLTAVQELFVKCVLEGLNVADCAKKIGRSERTMYDWRRLPHVAQAISDGCQAGLAQARAHLSEKAIDVARSLTGIAVGDEEPDSAQVAACKASLEMAVRLGEYSGDAAATKVKHDVSATGVMMVPVFGGRTVDDWEKAVSKSETTDQDSTAESKGG